MLSELQLKEIASIISASDIKNFIDDNELGFLLFSIKEENKKSKVRVGYFGTLSIFGGVD